MAKTLKVTFKQESVTIGKCTEFTKSQNEYTAVRYQDNHCPVVVQHKQASCPAFARHLLFLLDWFE